MIADAWLDAESFKSPSLNSLAILAGELTANDVKRVAVRLFKETPVATVIVGNVEELKTAFAGHIEFQSAAPPEKSTVGPVVPTKKP